MGIPGSDKNNNDDQSIIVRVKDISRENFKF